MNVKAFSLVELIVAVSIAALLTAGAMASFYIAGDILRVKQGKGLIQDLIAREEGRILRDEYNRVTIQFLADFLVITREPAGATLGLSWASDQLDISSDGVLHQTDDRGRGLTAGSVVGGETRDIAAEFLLSAEEGWQYQLTSDDGASSVVALHHFNSNREKSVAADYNRLLLQPDGIVSLILEAPYAKHQVFDAAGSPVASADLTIRDTRDRRQESLTIQ